MAPEQAECRTDRIGPATDTWALGVILYELLAGRRPFAATASQQLKDQIVHAPAPPLRDARPGLDDGLEMIVAKCLAKDPGDRYATGGELADDLRRWLDGQPPKLRPWQRARQIVRALARHRWKSLAVVLLALAFAATPAVRNLTNPDRVWDRYEKQLEEGRPITLLGESGRPERSQWLTAEGTEPNRQNPESPFAIESYSMFALLQFLPRVPVRHFRLTAEICHKEASDSMGEAGIFCALAGNDNCLAFHSLSFNDVVPVSEVHPQAVQAKNAAQLNYMIYQQASTREPVIQRAALLSFPFPPAGRSAPKPWRTLALEVSPAVLRIYWDGIWGGEITRDLAARNARGLVASSRLGEVPTTLPLGGPLGIFVSRGRAEFKNVRVEPLGDD
jgi:serine/threonine protein kinase